MTRLRNLFVHRFPRLAVFVVALTGAVVGSTALRAGAADQAQQILSVTGIKGGLVVHLGCGDGKLTAALHANGSYLVHGLDADVRNIEAARRHIRSLGLYGPVSVEQWSGQRLPYADGLVNLAVVIGERRVPDAEWLRVLAPNGAVLNAADPARVMLRKPWPKDIDEWTHHLHDSGGNAVARDTVVGPPQHLQWTAGPLWSRSHGWSPSVSAMVSASGRVFYINDETLTGVDGTVPDKWVLAARNAFNGVLLWKRPVPHWGSKELSGTPGTGAGFTTGRFTMPPDLGKRLVAVGDTVYVTLGADAPVTALDAATGQERRVFAETARADELLVSDGRLIVTLNPSAKPDVALPDRNNPPPPTPGKQVCAMDAKTGKLLWQRGPFNAIRATRTQDPFGRLELVADNGRVFVLTDEAVESMAADTGKTLWRIPRPALPASAERRIGFAGMYEFLLTVMVVHDGTVLLAQPEPNAAHSYHTMPGALYAFDARDGRQLWKHAYGTWGHCTQPDVFVVGDLVWTHVNTDGKFNIDAKGWLHVPDTSPFDYRIQALDVKTGALKKELPTHDIFDVGHHHRCYRNKITEQFLMSSRRGVEFVDLASGENWQNHWVRSGCLLGNLPCNGLLYVAPHDCGCYFDAKLAGFNALAPRSKAVAQPVAKEERLERGPAFAEISNLKSEISTSDDWPTYRHDGRRSGATEARVETSLQVRWSTAVGGKLSAPVIAEGKVFVADVDGHAVQALDQSAGRPAWRFTTGGRVNSPPTIQQGRAIFGSADGHAYALRAADGSLAWRFTAAPEERRLCAFEQLESAWPVPGSVLMQKGTCWFAAGRSSYLDGGIRLYALDPATANVARQETIYHPDPKTGKMAVETSGFDLPGLLNDIPATDGANVFIRQMNVSAPADRGQPHLYATVGYLDDNWFNRALWKYGPAETSGLMVLGQGVIFGMELYSSRSRETVFKPGSSAYQLVCRPQGKPDKTAGAKAGKRAKKNDPGDANATWAEHLPIRVTALVRAADTIFAAGSPDMVDPADPHGAWEGRKGGVLTAFAVKDGKKLAEVKLPSPPVWDGMAAAGGCLYLSLMDGKVLCLAAAQ